MMKNTYKTRVQSLKFENKFLILLIAIFCIFLFLFFYSNHHIYKRSIASVEDKSCVENLYSILSSARNTPRETIDLFAKIRASRIRGKSQNAAKMEEYLKDLLLAIFQDRGGYAVNAERGVTGAKILYKRIKFADQNGVMKGYWIGVVSKETGGYNDAAVEVAAYEVDRLFGFNIVPPTVFTTDEGKPFSLQYFVPDTKHGEFDLQIGSDLNRIKELSIVQQHQIKKQMLFDYIIDNFDRNSGNYMWDTSGKIVSIDHSIAMRNTKSDNMLNEQYIPYIISYLKSREGENIVSLLRTRRDSLEKVVGEMVSKERIDTIKLRIDKVLSLTE